MNFFLSTICKQIAVFQTSFSCDDFHQQWHDQLTRENVGVFEETTNQKRHKIDAEF